MKKIIFVGGTAYSGSTMFHLILANDPHGFATGEVHALFNPRMPHHSTPKCGCGDDGCQIWHDIRKNGEDNLFDSIFERCPEVNFVVSSSKNPFWIHAQNKLAQSKGFETKNVLIWKSPLEFAQSTKKRGQYGIWEKSWINYYRLYAALMDEWRAIKYYNVANHPEETLIDVCNYLGIPNPPDKRDFWQKKSHVLFGNYSARMHLVEEKAAKDLVANTNASNWADHHRRIHYRESDDTTLSQLVDEIVKESPYIDDIRRMLEDFDIAQTDVNRRLQSAVQMPFHSIFPRQMKNGLLNRIGKIRYLK